MNDKNILYREAKLWQDFAENMTSLYKGFVSYSDVIDICDPLKHIFDKLITLKISKNKEIKSNV